MKLGLKIIAGIFLLIITLIIVLITKDTITAKSYINKVVAWEILDDDDKIFLNTNFQISESETVLLTFARLKSYRYGGLLLTDKRIISYLEGQTLKTCDVSDLNDIKEVNIDTTKDFINGSHVKVIRNDSTAMSFSITQFQFNHMMFVDRLRKEIKKKQKGDLDVF